MSKKLLLEIAHCPNVPLCLTTDHSCPCRNIVSVQAEMLQNFQVPEPWSGQLTRAPLLFLSSNPSISTQEVYPRWSCSDGEIVDFFNNRFERWIQDGKRCLLQGEGDTYSHSVAFWAAVRQRARELYDRDEVKPGRDYALTEVVHCKSKQERGVVRKALWECSRRYLCQVLRTSAAAVIVVLGSLAKQAVVRELGLSIDDEQVVPFMRSKNRKQYIAFLPHPNARKARTCADVLSAKELGLLSSLLNATNGERTHR